MTDLHGQVNNWLMITKPHYHILLSTHNKDILDITMYVKNEMVH